MKNEMMKNSFFLTSDLFGNLDLGLYKKREVETKYGTSLVPVESYSLTESIKILHEWLEEYYTESELSGSFHVMGVDGSLDKRGDVKYTKVYTITSSKIKKYLDV